MIEDDSGDIVASPKGPIDYQGDMVVEEIVFGLNEDQLYWVQAMVATDLPEGRISSERIMIGINLFVCACIRVAITVVDSYIT